MFGLWCQSHLVPTEWTCKLVSRHVGAGPNTASCLGVSTAITDQFAAAPERNTFAFLKMKRHWQTADRAVSVATAFRLREKEVVTQFSHPLLARCFMLRTMIYLACDAAVANEIAIGSTCRQLDVIQFSDTAGSTMRNVARLSTC